MKKIIILALGLFLCSFGTAFSAPMQWSVEDGGNGHWYEVVVNPDPWGVWTWDYAQAAAAAASHNGLQGHLVTATTQAESDFISSSAFLGSVFGGLFAETIWLGGYQDSDAAAQEDGWHWVTGEEWDYTDWNSSQPNNLSHNYLAMSAGSTSPGSGWYDMPVDGKFWPDVNSAYIIEYEPSSQVPVPGTLFLLMSGLAGMAIAGRKFS